VAGDGTVPAVRVREASAMAAVRVGCRILLFCYFKEEPAINLDCA
jgi:hypothetical protein